MLLEQPLMARLGCHLVHLEDTAIEPPISVAHAKGLSHLTRLRCAPHSCSMCPCGACKVCFPRHSSTLGGKPLCAAVPWEADLLHAFWGIPAQSH